MKFRLERPSPAALIALAALFVALGGPAEAARLINGRLIKRNTVTGAAIKDHSLSTRDLSSAAVRSLMATRVGSIGTDQLAFAAVTAAKLAPNSVAGDKLADSSVNGAKVADESLTAADLGPNSVGNSELQNNSVGKAKIGSNAVGTAELQDNSVGAAELADNSVDTGAIVNGTIKQEDLASFVRTVSVALPQVAAKSCAGADAPVTEDLSADAIAITPPASWPDGLTVTARPTSPTALRVSVCNLDVAPANPGTTTFRYVAFG
jgi:hypothetical protein